MNEPGPWLPPTSPPQQWGVHSTTEAVSNKPSTGARSILIAVIAAVAAIGVAGVVTLQRLTPASGADTPEAAFEGLFRAISDEDLAAMIMLMAPAERDALLEPGSALVAEFQRLTMLDAFPGGDQLRSDGGDPTIDLSAVDLSVEGLTYSSERLDPRLATFTTTGGTLTAALDLSGLDLDSEFDELNELGIDDLEARATSGESIDLGQDPATLAVVEHDGSWYISVMYSIAEAMRTEAGARFPGLGSGPTPIGGTTPEAAVEAMLHSLMSVDLEGTIATLDPAEMAALYDYAPLLADDMAALRRQFDEGGIALDPTRLDLVSQTRDGRTTVRVEGFEIVIAEGDSSTTITFDGNCLTGDPALLGDSGRLCLDTIANPSSALASLVRLPVLTVVERDGTWFVSVIPTLLYMVVDTMAVVDDDMMSAWSDSLLDISGLADDLLPQMNGYPGLGADDLFDGESGGFDENFDMGNVESFTVVKEISTGTPADDLLAEGYVEAFSVSMDDARFEDVWSIESEIGGMVATRTIAVGEVLPVDAFDVVSSD